MKMKRNTLTLGLIGLTLFLGLMLILNLLSTGPAVDQESMAAANQLYNAGHYLEAAQLYEQMSAAGVQNSSLFYNLGNAYYQQGDMGSRYFELPAGGPVEPTRCGHPDKPGNGSKPDQQPSTRGVS